MSLIISTTRGDGARAVLAVDAVPDASVGDLGAWLVRADPTRRAALGVGELAVVVTPLSAGPHAAARTVPSDLLVAASGIRSGDHVDVVPADRAAPREASLTAATVGVVHGPDAGATVSLRVGSHVVGCAADAAVRLTDPLVSQRHARIVVGESIEVVDLGSANGVRVDDAYVTRATLAAGDHVTIGDTTFTVAATPVGARLAPVDSVVAFTRSPRVVPALPRETIALPHPPSLPTPRQFPRMAMVGPVVLGLGMYAMTGRVLSLLFIGLSPLMMLGSYLDSRVLVRRRARRARARFEASLGAAQAAARHAHHREREARAARSPSLADVVCAAEEVAAPLWTHRPEHEQFLEVRVGTGTVPSTLTIEGPGDADADEEAWRRSRTVADRFATIADVPVVAHLRDAGSLGFAGADHAADTARAALAHVVGLHSPRECVVAGFVSGDGSGGWRWLEWLPHATVEVRPLPRDRVAGTRAACQRLLVCLEELVAGRTGVDIGAYRARPRAAHAGEGALPEPVLPAVVVVVEEGAPVERRRLIRLAEKGPDAGVHLVWLARDVARIPAACRCAVDLEAAAAATVAHVRRSGFDEPVLADRLSAPEAEAFARRLACVEDAGFVDDGGAEVPRAVTYVEAHGAECAEAGTYARRWTAATGGQPRSASLRALVGHAHAEPFYLDLAAQGPHALVGGTTGAGKSEFLQSWILGMAAAYAPTAVTFLLVDYKGGSAFAECVRLPHTVGLVTDLAPHLVERALTSLRAELRHRERLLAAKGAKDLRALTDAGDPEAPPRLVIVIDEFAALAREVPDFVDGMVDIAQRGRSLGLHLIMATQRPAGVIKDNLRANTNLRIALRVADEADSTDVLGAPAAAHIDPTLPGRAMARSGPGRVETFQAAYAGARAGAATAPRVTARELALGGGSAWAPPDEPAPAVSGGATDAQRAVDAMREAATTLALPPPRRPWLDELAASYDIGELAATPGAGYAFGLVDDPSHQSQAVARFDPDADGSMLVLGGPGSGVSTALRAIVAGAVLASGDGPVHVYGIEASSGSLSIVSCLDAVGDVVAVDDAERVARLVTGLASEVRARRSRFTGARVASLPAYRAATGDALPRILLMVDGYGALQAQLLHELGRQRVFADLTELLADGRAVGVHAVLGADRLGALHTSVQALMSRTIALRLHDDASYGMLGLRPPASAYEAPPGRGIDVATKRELHIAVPGGSVRFDEQVRAIDALAERTRLDAPARPEPVPRMPSHVNGSSLPADVGGLPVLGVDGATLAPRGVDLDRSIMIAGQAGTGRTCALAWLACAIRRAEPGARIVHVSARRSALRGLAAWTASYASPTAAEDFLADWGEALAQDQGEARLVVCIEHVQDYAAPSDGAFVAALKAAKRRGHTLVGEADVVGWASGPLASEIKAGRRGLMLAPEGTDTQMLFAVAPPRDARGDMPPGRALWIESGRAHTVQVPWVDDALSTEMRRPAAGPAQPA